MYSDLGPWSDPRYKATVPDSPTTPTLVSSRTVPSPVLATAVTSSLKDPAPGPTPPPAPTRSDLQEAASPAPSDYLSPSEDFDVDLDLDFKAFHISGVQPESVRMDEDLVGPRGRHRPTPSMRLILMDGDLDLTAPLQRAPSEKTVLLPVTPKKPAH